MKWNFKLIGISMMLFTILYASSLDQVLGDHKIGDEVIHKDLYELNIKSSPPGLHIDDSAIYEKDTWVVIDAAPERWGAYEFVRWTVNNEWVDGNPIRVLMDQDTAAVATYSLHPAKKQDSVNFNQDSSDGTTYDLKIISPYGQTIGSGSYSADEIVDFNVEETYVYDETDPGIRYAFSEWSDGFTPNLKTNFIKMDEDKTIYTTWNTQYKLEILDSIQDMKIIDTSWHDVNSTAPLVMSVVDTDSDVKVKRTINKWISSGPNFADIAEPTNPITSVKMENPYSISMDWKDQFYLDVKSKYGQVDGSGFYDKDDIVVASIDSSIQESGIPGTRLIFDGWKGDVNSDGENVQVIMNEPKTLEGVWKKQYLLTVNSDYGSPRGTNWYDEGSIASFGTNIPRDPAGMWQQTSFQGWIGDADATSLAGSILMNGPKTVTAQWNVDYTIAYINIGIIAGVAIGGLFLFNKLKQSEKNRIPSSKETLDSIEEKRIKRSSLSKMFGGKINFGKDDVSIENKDYDVVLENTASEKKIQLEKTQELRENIDAEKENVMKKSIQLDKRLSEIELEQKESEIKFEKKKLEEKTKLLEKNLSDVEEEKQNILKEKEQLEKSLTETKFEKKKITIKLENDIAEVSLQKKNLSEKTEQLEQMLSEVDREKKRITQEKIQLKIKLQEVEQKKNGIIDNLEQKTRRIELERKELEINLKKKYAEVDIQKKNLSEKTEQLEKSLLDIEFQKQSLSQKKEHLEDSITDIVLQKKKISSDFENKIELFEFERKSRIKRISELENQLEKAESEKKQKEIELQKNLSAIEITKQRISQKTEELDKNLYEVKLEKKAVLFEKEQLEKTLTAADLERKILSQKTIELEKGLLKLKKEKENHTSEIQKNFSAIELQKKSVSQQISELEKRIKEVEQEKKNVGITLERKESEIESIKKNFEEKTKQLENDLETVNFQKTNLSEKTKQLQISLTDVENQKKNVIDEKRQLEIRLSEIEFEKMKNAVDLEKNMGNVELEKKKTIIKLENEIAEANLQRQSFSEKTKQLEANLNDVTKQKAELSEKTKQLNKIIAETEFEKRQISDDFKNKEKTFDLEIKSKTIELQKKENELIFANQDLESKTKQLKSNLAEIDTQKKNLSSQRIELENKLTKINIEKRKLSSELERKESLIEAEEKRLGQKIWDLEKRISHFSLEQKIASIELEKKKINAEIERKEALIELEKEHLSQRRGDLEKSIAAIEIEKDLVPTKIQIQKNSKSGKKNTLKSHDLENIIAEIELAQKVSAVELERKESVISLQKKNLDEQEEMLQKRISGLDVERKISSVQIARIESEIELEKKNLKQQTREFGKNNSKNLDLTKKIIDYPYSTDFDQNSYEKFREWTNVVNDELSLKSSSDDKQHELYSGDGK